MRSLAAGDRQRVAAVAVTCPSGNTRCLNLPAGLVSGRASRCPTRTPKPRRGHEHLATRVRPCGRCGRRDPPVPRRLPAGRHRRPRRRIAATRWPERETVTDDSQGVPLQTMQDLPRYWATEYDWSACEARLNALPNFVTEIDGLDIHFLHIRSAARGRAAADRDARVAGLDRRAAEDHRAADQSDGARRECVGRVPSGDPVAAGTRVLGQADGDRLGSRSAPRVPG